MGRLERVRISLGAVIVPSKIEGGEQRGFALPGESGNCRDTPTADGCTKAYYQEHEGYDLAFAEYSDRGNAFSDRYIGDVLERIQQRADNGGVVLVTPEMLGQRLHYAR